MSKEIGSEIPKNGGVYCRAWRILKEKVEETRKDPKIYYKLNALINDCFKQAVNEEVIDAKMR